MNIAVISPHSNNNGVTTVASFVAMELGARGKKTCLTHTASKSSSMMNYFGFDETEEDKTANPARMVKMLKEGILKRDEISEYCRPVTPTMEVYSANDANFDSSDMQFALEYIVNTFPHDFVVFDIDIKDADDENVKLVLGRSDFIILVIEQSIKEVYNFKTGYNKVLKLIRNKPTMMVINRYNPVAGKPNDLADSIGIRNIKKTSSWLYLRYNPYIMKYANSGKLPALHKAMRTNDSRIIDISSDVKNIVNRIMKFRTAKRLGGTTGTAVKTEETSEKTEEVKAETEK